MSHAEAVTVMDSGGLEQLEGFPTEGSLEIWTALCSIAFTLPSPKLNTGAAVCGSRSKTEGGNVVHGWA